MAWISADRIALPLREFAARHRDRTLPGNAIALTFDDGYACTAEVAAPLLEEFGIPATIFVPPELIERGRPFWWDELEHIVLAHDRDHMVVDGEAAFVGDQDPRDGQWKPGAPPVTARQQAFQRLWAALRERPPAEIERAMEELRSQSLEFAKSAPRPMSPAQVGLIAKGCIEFGSHALTHPWLSSLASSEKAREICDSVERCERLTGERPASFAYPYGHFDAECEQIVSEAGFTCACATIGTPVKATSRPFALPRLHVGDWNARSLSSQLGPS